MTEHILTHDPTADTNTDAVFVCSACGKSFGFNLPGVGRPPAVAGPGRTFLPPADWQRYTGPCDAAVTEKTRLDDAVVRLDVALTKIDDALARIAKLEEGRGG